MKPLIKWVGGKYSLSQQIIPLVEKHLNISDYDTYVEPFLGGGGMLFAMLNRYSFSSVVASDINGELINMYVQVRDDCKALEGLLRSFEERYNSFRTNKDKEEFYYECRREYNQHIVDERRDVRTAALFIALNKLCFNGLYRVNRDGLFNVPFGHKLKASLADYANLIEVSRSIQKVRFLESSFEASTVHASPKTLYYFDSPYRPVSDTAAFTAYSKSGFNDESQMKLAELTKAVQMEGAGFVLSNSDPTELNPNDRFFTDLYKHASIEKVSARRAVSASRSGRKKVSEILVIG